MDDKIPVQSAARESGGKAEGATTARMRGARNKDHQGKHRKRAHPYAGVMSTDDRAEQTDAVFEGKKLEDAAGGVLRPEEAILGTASMGTRLLHQNSRGSDPGNDQRIYRKPEPGESG